MENEIQHSRRVGRINAQNTTRKTRTFPTLGKNEPRQTKGSTGGAS